MDKKLENKLYRKFSFLKKKFIPNIECEDGWYDIIYRMCLKLDDIKKSDEFIITSIFDRYTNMDVHTKFGNNSTRFCIEEFKEESTDVCDACGNNKELEKCEKCTVPLVIYPQQNEKEVKDDSCCNNGGCDNGGGCCNNGGCNCTP